VKTFRKNCRLLLLVLTALCSVPSCTPEDGMDGRDGIDGINGMDGVDGMDGTDGQDGVDGQDGTVNVRSFTYDLRNVSGPLYDQNIPELTEYVIANDIILGYVRPFTSDVLLPLPSISSWLPFNIAVFIRTGVYSMDFVDSDGNSVNIVAGQLTSLRVIIIESTASTAGKSTEDTLLESLKNKGVDVSDYYQVMDYFNLDH